MGHNDEALELFSHKEYRARQNVSQTNNAREAKIRSVWYKKIRPELKAAYERVVPKINVDKIGPLIDYDGEPTKLKITSNANSFLGDFMDYRARYGRYSIVGMSGMGEIARIPNYYSNTEKDDERIRRFFMPVVREFNKIIDIFSVAVSYEDDCTIYIVADFGVPAFQKLINEDGAVDSFLAMEALMRRDSSFGKPKTFNVKPHPIKGALTSTGGAAVIGLLVAGAKVNVTMGFTSTMFTSAIAFCMIASGIWSANEAAAKKWMIKHPTEAESASLSVLEHKYAPIINAEATKLKQIIDEATPVLKEAGFNVKPGTGMKKNKNPYSMAGNCVAFIRRAGLSKSMDAGHKNAITDNLKDKIEELDEELVEKYDGKVRVASAFTDSWCAYFVVLDWFNSDGVILPNLT